jgi:hypothetical protein
MPTQPSPDLSVGLPAFDPDSDLLSIFKTQRTGSGLAIT